ncbi:hypothetical protein DFR52_101805 [Hoeflea marina]|uniref:Uncharacterized protein n=1 Tax=Hoeflea marina TaxID=274592 RepID=A0A317PTS8_9HYPH|nr:hypothetical protein DFR52_101805 [Hoeflea marina]
MKRSYEKPALVKSHLKLQTVTAQSIPSGSSKQ